MSELNLKKFRLDELPDSMIKDINLQIRYHSVIMLICNDDNLKVIPASGTLCKINTKFGIVTARHVWDHPESGIEKHSKITIHIKKRTYTIKKEYMSAIFPKIAGKKFGCELPDIAFIRIPDVMSSDLEASNKVFYSLNKPPIDHGIDLLEDLNGYWATFGSPISLLDPSNRKAPSLIYGTSIPTRFHENEWDYLQLKVISETNGMPKNAKGMSGGGIWRTLFSAHDFSILDVIFSGVNFCQTDRSDEYQIIGHGPKSIYDYLLKLIK